MKTDSQLRSDVSAQLDREPSLCAREIGIHVNAGIATLAGRVPAYADRWRAERAARRVPGLLGVVVELEVGALPAGGATLFRDDAIAAEYRDLVEAFVDRRLAAGEFLPQFFRLRQRDAAAGDPVARGVVGPAEHDLLDSVNVLCEAYTRALPDGAGYRVSEEQFRLEVGSIASTGAPLGLRPSGHPPPRSPPR